MQTPPLTIGLPVRSLPDSIGWYRTLLGSKPTSQLNPQILEFELQAGVRLQLVHASDFEPVGAPVPIEVSNLESERTRLRKAGLAVSEVVRLPAANADFLELRDPDGNPLRLVQRV